MIGVGKINPCITLSVSYCVSCDQILKVANSEQCSEVRRISGPSRTTVIYKLHVASFLSSVHFDIGDTSRCNHEFNCSFPDRLRPMTRFRRMMFQSSKDSLAIGD